MTALLYVGLAIFIIGGIGLLIAAFRTSILWGIVLIIISPVAIIYTILHWQEAKNPFFLQVLGLAIMLITSYLGAGSLDALRS
jgi:uncharacterized membrane protein